MQTKTTVGIIGAAGYTGGELIRLLLNHPNIAITFALSRSNANTPVYQVHRDLFGDTHLEFTKEYANTVDVLFLCLPHKESKVWIENNSVSNQTKIIDLGNDFRLDGNFSQGEFTYGLSESNEEAIKKANYVANPGCFATAIQLALLPLAKEKKLNKVYTTGITGSTGAGQQLQPTSHFSWRTNNISAYKTLNHQHVPEICQTLEKINQEKIQLEFIPWRGDFTRGIFTSSTLESNATLEELYKIYETFYKGNPFVFVSKNTIDLKQVVNTNKCLIHIEKQGEQVVVHSIIDNLIKGASGQAIQNMNLMLGWEPTLGLKLKASAF